MTLPAHEASSVGLSALRSPEGAPLSPLARLRRLASLERGDLTVITLYAAATGLVSLAVPIAAQSLVNTVAFTALPQPLVALTVLLFLGLLAAGLCSILQQKIIETVHQRFFVRTAHDVARRLLEVDLAKVPGPAAAQLTNRFFDVAVVQKASSTLLVDGLSATLQGLVSLLLLAFYHPALLAFDLVLLACVAFILFGLGRGGVETALKESKLKYETGAWLEQIAQAPAAFKQPRAAAFAFARTDELAAGYVRARARHFRVLLRQIVASHVLQALATAALLGLGGALVLAEQLTLGQLVAAELAVTGVVVSVAKSSKSLASYYDLVAALDKVGSLTDLPRETRGATVPPGRGASLVVALRDVELGAPGRAAPGDVRLTLAPGRPLAVLGEPTGGRAALVELLSGARVPARGRVEIDGIDTRAWSADALRSQIQVVAGATLFEGTVADNLCWGAPAAGAARVFEVLALVGLDQLVAELPEGLATSLSPAREPLTPDQALRLTLARALLAEPRLLLLDGALDALGVGLSARLLSGLGEVCPGAAVIVLTQREDVAALVGDVRRMSDGVLSDAREAA